MTEPPTSLDRLNDLVVPPPAPWWPLAPGWNIVLVAALLTLLAFLYRAFKHWRANAYRRAALHELATLDSPTEIAALLRRTALAIAPREIVAEKTGTAWLDWLTALCNEPMLPTVRQQLTDAVYAPTSSENSITDLRDYATCWIARHRFVEPPETQPSLKC